MSKTGWNFGSSLSYERWLSRQILMVVWLKKGHDSIFETAYFFCGHETQWTFCMVVWCKCRSLRFNRYSFLDWTLPPAPVASGWKVREELPAWTLAGANSVFFQIECMRDWRFSLWVTSKAKRGKHMNSLVLIRFKLSLSWCVSFFGTFTSAFILFQFSRWRMYSWRMYGCFYAEHVRK